MSELDMAGAHFSWAIEGWRRLSWRTAEQRRPQCGLRQGLWWFWMRRRHGLARARDEQSRARTGKQGEMTEVLKEGTYFSDLGLVESGELMMKHGFAGLGMKVWFGDEGWARAVRDLRIEGDEHEAPKPWQQRSKVAREARRRGLGGSMGWATAFCSDVKEAVRSSTAGRGTSDCGRNFDGLVACRCGGLARWRRTNPAAASRLSGAVFVID
ncbi:hypothetical protein M0R45_035689 [Rubus argutus]|uniref:Uncharacterized protein n=1 Tax=Rubus argutus TaxID=59490 RepID=A0AAW1VTV0_RUBAR